MRGARAGYDGDMSHAHKFMILFGFAAAVLATPALAAHDEKDIPYWGSIRAETANMRVGPGEDYRINWIYRRQHLPIKVLRAMEGWRLIEDPDGARGWMLAKFISREREGYVIGKEAVPMHQTPEFTSQVLWKLAPGMLGKLGDCADGWCRIEIEGRGGFVRETSLWGTVKLKD